MVPLVRGRLTHVNGTPLDQRSLTQNAGTTDNEGSQQQFRNREQNISLSEGLPPGDQVIDGNFWPQFQNEKHKKPSADGGIFEVSVEERFAQRLGVTLGDDLRFFVAGASWNLKITSIRSVPWQNLQPHFFLVAHPQAFLGVPPVYFAAAKLLTSNNHASVTLELRKQFPDLTIIDVQKIGVALENMIASLVTLVTGLFLCLFFCCMLMGFVQILAERADIASQDKLFFQLGATPALLARVRLLQGILTYGVSMGAGIFCGVGFATLLLRYFWELPVWPAAEVPLALGTLLAGVVWLVASKVQRPTSIP